MARAMWSGVISFGMVTIPVKLFSATESHNVSFHQVHAKCETRIREHRYCPHCEREVDWNEIVKGFEYTKNKFVVLTDDDFENLPLPSRHTIELSAFVAEDEIDPIYIDAAYYVGIEDKSAQKPYKLLVESMKDQSVVGVAAVTFRNRERMCALRAVGDRICLQTLFYEDEIRDNESSKPSSVSISAPEKKMAATLIKSLSSKFTPSKYKDSYQDALKKLIKAKMKGGKIEISKPREATQPSDLMQLLQDSLNNAKSKKREVSGTKSGARSVADTAKKEKSSRAKSSGAKSDKAKPSESKTGKSSAKKSPSRKRASRVA